MLKLYYIYIWFDILKGNIMFIIIFILSKIILKEYIKFDIELDKRL